jgi:hypothetical protein
VSSTRGSGRHGPGLSVPASRSRACRPRERVLHGAGGKQGDPRPPRDRAARERDRGAHGRTVHHACRPRARPASRPPGEDRLRSRLRVLRTEFGGLRLSVRGIPPRRVSPLPGWWPVARRSDDAPLGVLAPRALAAGDAGDARGAVARSGSTARPRHRPIRVRRVSAAVRTDCCGGGHGPGHDRPDDRRDTAAPAGAPQRQHE